MRHARWWHLAPLLALLWPIVPGCSRTPLVGPRVTGTRAPRTAAPAMPPLPPGAVRQQLLDGLPPLFDKDDPVPQDVDVVLFDQTLRIHFDRLDNSAQGSPVLSGEFVDRDGFLTLRRSGQSVSGSGWLDSVGALTLSPLSKGLALVVQGPELFQTNCASAQVADRSDPTQRCAEEPSSTPDPVTVDVVAMYTDEAVCAGYRCDLPDGKAYAECVLKHAIAGWIDGANRVLLKSQAGLQWRLVAVERLPFTETNGDLDHLLGELKNTSRDPGKALDDLRRTTAADAALVVVNLGNVDGLAQPLTLTGGKANGDHPIAIVTRQTAAAKAMVTHELPHVLGAGHTDGDYGICSFSKAWRKHYGSFSARTVMDTSAAKLRLYLSSREPRGYYPDPMGADDIDNTRTLRIFRIDAAGWRSSTPPWPTFAPSGCGDYRPEYSLPTTASSGPLRTGGHGPVPSGAGGP